MKNWSAELNEGTTDIETLSKRPIVVNNLKTRQDVAEINSVLMKRFVGLQ